MYKAKIVLAAFLAVMISNTVPLYAEQKVEGSLSLTVDAKSAVIMEPFTGKVLYAQNPDERLAPASVTKIMTILLIYDAIEQGNIAYDDIVSVSEHAAKMGGSQIFLEPGEKQTVRDLLKSVIIASANDASVALAEFVSGSEESFADLMNKRAAGLGMANTQFKNACGLDAEGHYTSAFDIALMTRELISKYPQVYDYTKVWQDTIIHRTKRGDEEFGLTNTNRLIKWYNGATGLKTGSTGKALYCLSGTAERGGMDLIAVVLASPDPSARFQEVMKMLDYGFANYKMMDGKEPGTDAGTVRVSKGGRDELPVIVRGSVRTVVPKVSTGGLEPEIRIIGSVSAPVADGAKVGEIIYRYNGAEVGRSDLVTGAGTEEASLLEMMGKVWGMWF